MSRVVPPKSARKHRSRNANKLRNRLKNRRLSTWELLTTRPLELLFHWGRHVGALLDCAIPRDVQGFLLLFSSLLLIVNMFKISDSIMNFRLHMLRFPTFEGVQLNYHVILCYLLMHIPASLSWALERYIPERRSALCKITTAALQLANCFTMFYLPYYTVTRFQPHIVISTILIGFSIVWLFKLISLHHVCSDFRDARRKKVDLATICSFEDELPVIQHFPQCLTYQHFYRFLVMPTMCFQFAFPSFTEFRWIVVIKHAIKACLWIILSKVIVKHFMLATLYNGITTIDFAANGILYTLYQFSLSVLELSIASVVVWLFGFLVVFHHWCTILAEVTLFGDRIYYTDWWNSNSMGEYWRRWNLPIHNFLRRHIYKPLLQRGCSRVVACAAVFLVSAILHEYIISIPLQMGLAWVAFIGFIGQVPLMYISNLPWPRTTMSWGNVFFWTSFCFVGQPVGIFAYYYLWGIDNGVFPPLRGLENGFLPLILGTA